MLFSDHRCTLGVFFSPTLSQRVTVRGCGGRVNEIEAANTVPACRHATGEESPLEQATTLVRARRYCVRRDGAAVGALRAPAAVAYGLSARARSAVFTGLEM